MFDYKDKKYCIEKNVDLKEYYKVTSDLKKGEKVGLIKKVTIKKNEYYAFEDKKAKVKYIFEIDEEKVLGKEVGKYDGKKKKLYK